MISLSKCKNKDKILNINKQQNTAVGRYYDKIFIPRSFENIILRHVILNSLNYSCYKPAPLLFLQGRKGEGKSFMTETILKGNNIVYRFISSSVLTGKREGEAVENLMLYYNMCEMNPAAGKYTALVIDDFHLSIAITKCNAGHTTNADNLLEALMNIADRKVPLKAPIILIGNDFTEAYPPLTRAGRANICTWEPSLEDKKEIVRNLIKQQSVGSSEITDEQINHLVETYRDQYIGFFEKAIGNAYFDEMEQVTNFFAESKGQVDSTHLSALIAKTLETKRLSITEIERQAQEIILSKPQKLDY